MDVPTELNSSTGVYDTLPAGGTACAAPRATSNPFITGNGGDPMPNSNPAMQLGPDYGVSSYADEEQEGTQIYDYLSTEKKFQGHTPEGAPAAPMPEYVPPEAAPIAPMQATALPRRQAGGGPQQRTEGYPIQRDVSCADAIAKLERCEQCRAGAMHRLFGTTAPGRQQVQEAPAPAPAPARTVDARRPMMQPVDIDKTWAAVVQYITERPLVTFLIAYLLLTKFYL